MALELTVQVVKEAASANASAGHTEEARLRLQHGLVFLAGRKLKPLKALERANFQGFDACLTWPGGPELRLRFPEAPGLNKLRDAVDAAKQKAASHPATLSTDEKTPPPRTHEATKVHRSAATPQALGTRRRPVREQQRAEPKEVDPCKRRKIDVFDQEGAAEEEEERPIPPPRIDATLTDTDRDVRRAQAAARAEARAEAHQLRGIGDVGSARRLRERAERDELLGCLQARCALQGHELPWNLGTLPIEELRGLAKSSGTCHGAS